ncbi:MAG: diaminopimelate epimerase [Desulfobacterales bacterium]|nr:diaminopimelate epimerase [Desulfobacterales bacterium]
MKPIPFTKMNGSGNDFIVIDNRNAIAPADLPAFIQSVCRRKLSVGADGLILIETDAAHDFKWQFYNADGSRAEMCGNGARCAARFAHINGIAGTQMTFNTDAGTIEAVVIGEDVKIRMTDPVGLTMDKALALSDGEQVVSHVNTGVPHAVVETEDLEAAPVRERGREIRYHPRFAPAGTNVNFMAVRGPGAIAVRTYERGVEDETLACGTGCVASALVAATRQGWDSPVAVTTRSGGILTIHYRREGQGFGVVHLEGDARIVYTAELQADALRR